MNIQDIIEIERIKEKTNPFSGVDNFKEVLEIKKEILDRFKSLCNKFEGIFYMTYNYYYSNDILVYKKLVSLINTKVEEINKDIKINFVINSYERNYADYSSDKIKDHFEISYSYYLEYISSEDSLKIDNDIYEKDVKELEKLVEDLENVFNLLKCHLGNLGMSKSKNAYRVHNIYPVIIKRGLITLAVVFFTILVSFSIYKAYEKENNMRNQRVIIYF